MGSLNAGEDAGEGYDPASEPLQALEALEGLEGLEECHLYLIIPPLMPIVCSCCCFLV